MLSLLYPDGRFRRGDYWFRGHASSQYTLEASFDRWFNTLGQSGASRTELAQQLLDSFKEEACWSPEYPAVKDSEAKIMALGRHYGLPTRQLDWSESPYVAAFFAFAACDLANGGRDDVAIWALNCNSYVWGTDNGVELERVERLGNIRLKHQVGGFTILRTPSANLEEHVEAFSPRDKQPFALWQFTVPDSLATEALADLDGMGINYASLFSGLDGAVLAAKMQMILRI
jgi:hypothetical protein